MRLRFKSGTILVAFQPGLFANPLACQGFFDSSLFARFQVEGMTLDFLDDVFLLYLALETPEGVL